MTWYPVLESDERPLALTIAVQISDSVAACSDPLTILLDAHIAKELGSDRHADRALAGLETLAARERPFGPGLYGGLAGLGFVAQHASSVLAPWIEAVDDDFMQRVDSALVQITRTYPSAGNFDLVSGLAGIALYAIERWPRPSARHLLESVVERLDADAVELGDAIVWPTLPSLLPEHQRRVAPSGYYNLGVAHGMPSVALILAQAVALGIKRARAGELLHGTVRWIIAQRTLSGRLPSWIAIGGGPAHECREAWCYGGLGASVVLLNVARLAGVAAWEDIALDMARVEAAQPKPDMVPNDACVCHGTAGNAHLYGRLYACTADEQFKAAARVLLLHTIKAFNRDVGMGGFLFRKPSKVRPFDLAWKPDGSFLSGAAGVGLVLLAASGTSEPTWDRLLGADTMDQATC